MTQVLRLFDYLDYEIVQGDLEGDITEVYLIQGRHVKDVFLFA